MEKPPITPRQDALGLLPRTAPPMFRQPDPEQVEVCRRWIRHHARHRETLNRKWHSYRLKHEVERDVGRYVSNGAFILAARIEGYRAEASAPGSINAVFNMAVQR